MPATLLELTDYFKSLLAYEYRGLPNATRQMALYAKQFVADNLAASLETAFILDTAVGAQLDIIGKYVGISRNIGSPLPQGYFGFWDYASSRDPTLYQGTWNPTTDIPTLPAAGAGNTGWWYVASENGTSTAPISATFTCGDVIFSNGTVWAKETTDNGNGLTSYTDNQINENGIFYDYVFSSSLNTNLTDSEYRAVIKLKIATNSSDGTLLSIVTILNLFFPHQIFVTDNKDMTLSYTVSFQVPLSQAVLEAYLPRPMGVGITVIVQAGLGLLLTESGDFITTEGGDRIIIT